MHEQPAFGRLGTCKLPRSWRALKGWRRLCPAYAPRGMVRSGRGDEEGRPNPHGCLPGPVRVDLQPPCRAFQVHHSLLAVSGGTQATACYCSPAGLPVRRVPRSLSTSLTESRPRSVSVPDPPLRTEYRPGEKLAEFVRGAEARQLENLQVGGQVRESRPAFVKLPESSSQSSGVHRFVRAMSRGCAPQSSSASGRTLRSRHSGAYFLDLFAGQGGVSRCLRQHGYRCCEFDVIHGPRCDLTSPAVQARILQAIRTGTVLGIMIALPCFSFSGARDRTSVIRSRDLPWGLTIPAVSFKVHGEARPYSLYVGQGRDTTPKTLL